jgi:hypothetical protein
MDLTRRTVAKGAAWVTPVVVLAAAAPTVAASVTCQPTLTVAPGSFKCCSGGPDKTMKVVLVVTDENGCAIPATADIVVTGVRLANGQPINQVLGLGVHVRLGETFVVTLLGVASCTVNLLVDLTVDGAARTAEVKSSNIPGGTATQCGA